jgi:hypothetical protein
MHNPFPPNVQDFGFGFAGLFGAIVWGFFTLLSLAVAIGLIFLLVRFLLVGTRAAQLYVAQHEPPRAAQPVAPTAPVIPSGDAPAGATVATPPRTASATKPATVPAAESTGATATKPMFSSPTAAPEVSRNDATEVLPVAARSAKAPRTPRTPKTPPTA